jgi:tetratricopeptide (TPR) repeat protein
MIVDMDYLSLCLICKDEHDYLAEWLDYHILMGVDRFYIYDNESRVSLSASLKNYIERGWVVLIDIPGKAMQLHAYDHCLQTFGPGTIWLGFIDTDEFLVSKTTSGLKELLQDYQAYGGLAVSSLFFGSNGHKTRPAAGQIAAYTRRTHETFQGNLLVKSIVQPAKVLLPASPHDFAYRENSYCVNEDRQLVDGMKAPIHTAKIQLNHYFCRSQSEIDLKLQRGQVYATDAWPRERFAVVNQQATYTDMTILERLTIVLGAAGVDVSGLVNRPDAAGLLEKMANLAAQRFPTPMELPSTHSAGPQARITSAVDLKAATLLAEERGNHQDAIRLISLRLQAMPTKINLFVDLSVNYLYLGDLGAAWQTLSQAWKLAPNSYPVLMGMAFFFLKAKDYAMAEKTCRLLLSMNPHNLLILGYLTEALMGQGRDSEALKIGLPVIELTDILGELPKGMAAHLVKLMADHLLEKRDYSRAARLWEARLAAQKDDLNVLLELIRALLLKGDQASARQRLAQAWSLAPQDKTVLALRAQIGAPLATVRSSHKQKHHEPFV